MKIERGIGLVMILLVGMVWSGCGKTQITDQNIQRVTIEQMDEVLADPEAVVVDVRNDEKFASGHIPGAIHIHLPKIRSRMNELANAKMIVVYSGGWRDRLGAAAVKKMIKLGYKNVFELQGGTNIWVDTGRELKTE